jgi:predicted ATP-grasp superfamily ATP-dependent carboligase
MRIFIYEFICAGGLGPDGPASLRREGWGMLAAIVADFQRLPGIEVVTLLDETLPHDAGDVSAEGSRIRQNAGLARGSTRILANAATKTSSAEEWRRFREIASRCDFTLVIAPEFDDLLEARSKAVLDAGGRLLGSLPEAIRLTADKLACANFWKGRGVRHPRTEMLDPLNFAAFPGPWVMKPRFGAGSQATFLIRNRDDELRTWSAAFHEYPEGEFIVQVYVRGQPASVALLIGPTQTIPLLPARQHLSRDGRFRYEGGSLPLPTPLAERAIALALKAVAGIDGLRGYAGVDLVLGDAGDDYVIEINPRLTTSYLGLRRLCQQNLAESILRLAKGETIAMPTWHAGEAHFSSEAGA